MNKNDRLKFDGRKKRQYLTNGKSEFNETKKFGINAKNYTGHSQQINDSNRVRNAEVEGGKEPSQENKGRRPKKGQEEHYFNGEDNGGQRGQVTDWMSRLRPRTRPTIPGNSTKKHKGKWNPK